VAGYAYITQVQDAPTRKALIDLADQLTKIRADLLALSATITTLQATVATLQAAQAPQP
jgi:prefoldin subunit 5